MYLGLFGISVKKVIFKVIYALTVIILIFPYCDLLVRDKTLLYLFILL